MQQPQVEGKSIRQTRSTPPGMETCYTCFFQKWLVKNGPSAEIQSNGDLFWDNGVAWRRGGSGVVVRQKSCCQKWCRLIIIGLGALIMFQAALMGAKDSGGDGGGSGGSANCEQTGCRGSSSSKTSGGGGGGCFVPGSLVLTETNEAFPIEDISLGDVVAGGGRVTAILQFDGSTEDL